LHVCVVLDVENCLDGAVQLVSVHDTTDIPVRYDVVAVERVAGARRLDFLKQGYSFLVLWEAEEL